MKYVVRLQDLPNAQAMGGKAFQLSRLRQRDLLIPQGFVMTPAAFAASLTREQRDRLHDWQSQTKINVQALQAVLADVRLGEGVQTEILQILAEMFPYGGHFAVRSSALDEDQAQYSLAGQLTTFLSVKLEDLYDKIAQVWRSAYRETVLLYRQRQGLSGLPQPSAVLVQQMLEPSVSGVAFGADPVTGRRNIRLVSAVYGLGTTLVSGESDADTFYVDAHDQIVQRQIARKVKAAYANPLSESGVSIKRIEDDRIDQPTLSDAQILAVASLVRQVGRALAAPQDIEWAIAQTGQLYLLQARPITALPAAPEPTGRYQIWDNSNIAESYSGVTTPLTFAFARRAYTEVYRQFCRVMGISWVEIQRRDRVFANMIGLLQGRIYYNLLNWYRVLAMLPGFRLNRGFMEQMMGVKEPLPEAIVAEIEAKNRWQDGFNLGRSLLSLGSNYLLLPLKIWQFKRRLNRVLSQQKTDLEYLRIDELVNHYRDLEQQLLPHWQAPIINDFFAMIFYGLLRKFTARWGEESGDAIANTLIQQQSRQQRSRQSSGTEAGQMISARPARQIHAMAQEIRATPALIDTFCRGTRSEIQATLNYHPPLAAQYAAYLNEFSDRCLDELKLESPTLADDPLPLLRSIGLVARDQAVQAQGNGSRPRPSRPPLHLKRRLRALGLQRLWLGFLVHNARARLRDRENLRFERTRVFGLARKLFLEMGKRLFALDAIAQAHDIFYLEINEILGFTEGTSTCTDLKSLIALRRAEFESYRQTESPPNRLSTYGVPYPYPEQRAAAIGSTALATSDRQRQGLGCSPGIVRGVVRLIRDPHQALAAPKGIPTGAILVAERTDPGWILLFPMAAGLVVERGSLLSHAAIVSRELGLPAIVSVPGVMTWLQDGDWVELDGGTGRVVKIESRQ